METGGTVQPRSLTGAQAHRVATQMFGKGKK